PELKLRPGMTANVTFITEERGDALAVPNTALRFTPAPEVLAKLGLSPDQLMAQASGRGMGEAAGLGARVAMAGNTGAGPASDGAAFAETAPKRRRNARVIWRMGAGGTLEPVRVEIGISDGQKTEIIGGELREGDQVIVGTDDGSQ